MPVAKRYSREEWASLYGAHGHNLAAMSRATGIARTTLMHYRDIYSAPEPTPVKGPHTWQVTGVVAVERPCFEDVYHKAVEAFNRRLALETRKANQTIKFTQRRVTIVYGADEHVGDDGTDIERLMYEADIVAETPNMYWANLGDIWNRFIVLALQNLNFNAEQTMVDQVVLGEGFLERIGHKLLAYCSGNHEEWEHKSTGVDHIRDLVAKHAPQALYDTDDILVKVQVDDWEVAHRFRHKWKGHSQYNDVHSIMKAQKWEQDFQVGVGGHTHASGLADPFNANGKQCMAVLCGSYKRFDDYRRKCQYPKPNKSTAVALMYDADDQSIQPFENLEKAARVMEALA